jgi:excisionase family DNA binding protein
MFDDTKPLTYSVDEAAQLLGIGRDAAYKACEAGQLPYIQLGSNRRRIPRVAIEKILADAVAQLDVKR